MSKSMLQEEFFQSNQWQTAMECLSLNLEEVVHIRNVLTKAELESLPVDCSTKEDVLKGKVCIFLHIKNVLYSQNYFNDSNAIFYGQCFVRSVSYVSRQGLACLDHGGIPASFASGWCVPNVAQRYK